MQTCILFRGKVNWTDDSESLAFGDEGVPCSGALSRTAYGALGLTSSRCIAPAQNGGDGVLADHTAWYWGADPDVRYRRLGAHNGCVHSLA